jgi:hypothetical protein
MGGYSTSNRRGVKSQRLLDTYPKIEQARFTTWKNPAEQIFSSPDW